MTSTGFGNNASSGLSTSTGNNSTIGTSVTVFAGESGTISETLTNAANYTATLACTGTTGLVGNTLTIGAADTAITCTQTNTREPRPWSCAKSWVNALNGDRPPRSRCRRHGQCVVRPVELDRQQRRT